MSERKRILVVDDSAMMLDMTRRALRIAGFDVVIAQDMAQLEEARQTGPFSLILVDVEMPGQRGDKVAVNLRQRSGANTPIFLLSDMDESELSRTAEAAKVAGYICKRHGMASLVRNISSALN